MAFKFLRTISEARTFSKAGNLSVKTDGKAGLKPKTNWLGEKPKLLSHAFLAATDHASAMCTSQFASSDTLLTRVPITPFKRSHTPLDHGLSAAVAIILTLNDAPNSLSSGLLNSPPLSVSILAGAPNIVIQLRNTPEIIVEGILFFTTVAAQKRVQRSTITRKIFEHHTFRSIAKTSLKVFARGIHTTGLGEGLLNFKHVWH
ncbi:unnamed protein product [Meganyctiphanes norvegica]|uniref:Uncharacterized protein n=1 Tax=Meganyctiphanes norvegica TaxID=48144 RepID=A0AAV2QEJ1_MEGNR